MSETVDEDPRVRQTKGAVMGAFLDLVLLRRYDELKVSEIIARAGVARSTFYEHFLGKDELLRQGLAGPLSVVAGSVTDPCDLDELAATVEHFWQHRRVANALLASGMRTKVTRILADHVERKLSERLAGSASPALRRLVARQIAGGHLSLVAAWLAGEASSTPLVIADTLHRMASGALTALEEG